MTIRRMLLGAAGASLVTGAAVALAAPSTAPPVVSVKLSTGAPAVTGAESLGSGPVTFSAATSGKGEREVAILALAPGADPAAVQQFVDKTNDPDKIEADKRFSIVADVSAVPGHAGRQTATLAPGTYLAADITREKGAPSTTFTVGDASNGASAPKPVATVDLHDFKFTLNRSLPRSGVVRFRNRGKAIHMAISFRVKDARAAADVVSQLKRGNDKVLRTKVQGTGTSLNPISPGRAVDLDFADKPGNYVFVCFWSSKKSHGKPHFAEGMVKAVTVK